MINYGVTDFKCHLLLGILVNERVNNLPCCHKYVGGIHNEHFPQSFWVIILHFSTQETHHCYNEICLKFVLYHVKPHTQNGDIISNTLQGKILWLFFTFYSCFLLQLILIKEKKKKKQGLDKTTILHFNIQDFKIQKVIYWVAKYHRDVESLFKRTFH